MSPRFAVLLTILLSSSLSSATIKWACGPVSEIENKKMFLGEILIIPLNEDVARFIDWVPPKTNICLQGTLTNYQIFAYTHYFVHAFNARLAKPGE